MFCKSWGVGEWGPKLGLSLLKLGKLHANIATVGVCVSQHMINALGKRFTPHAQK